MTTEKKQKSFFNKLPDEIYKLNSLIHENPLKSLNLDYVNSEIFEDRKICVNYCPKSLTKRLFKELCSYKVDIDKISRKDRIDQINKAALASKNGKGGDDARSFAMIKITKPIEWDVTITVNVTTAPNDVKKGINPFSLRLALNDSYVTAHYRIASPVGRCEDFNSVAVIAH